MQTLAQLGCTSWGGMQRQMLKGSPLCCQQVLHLPLSWCCVSLPCRACSCGAGAQQNRSAVGRVLQAGL